MFTNRPRRFLFTAAGFALPDASSIFAPNGGCYGSAFALTRDVRLDDGARELLVFSARSRRDVVCLIAEAFAGDPCLMSA